MTEVVFPTDSPNGIGLSPDNDTLYWAETHTGRVFRREISAPGELVPPNPLDLSVVLYGLPGMQFLDSLAVDGEGWVCVATIYNGGITAISPDGTEVEHYATGDLLTTNICFGGDDLRTAYVTCSSTGKLVSFPWPRPGLASRPPMTAVADGAGTPRAVPVIDIGAFVHGDADARAPTSLPRSTGHAVRSGSSRSSVTASPPRRSTRRAAVALMFFDLPVADRLAVAMPEPGYPYGYNPMRAETLNRSIGGLTPPDLKETFNVGPIDPPPRPLEEMDDPDERAVYAPNLWPAEPPGFRPAIEAFYRAMAALSATIMEAFAVALGLDARAFDPLHRRARVSAPAGALSRHRRRAPSPVNSVPVRTRTTARSPCCGPTASRASRSRPRRGSGSTSPMWTVG